MPDFPPPLKVLSTGATQAIPVYELEFVTGTLVKASPIRARYTPPAGGGASVTYAATGNQYVTLVDAADLTADRVLTASTGIQIRDVGANSAVFVYIDSFVVTSTRTISTTYPLAGGGNLSADRTFSADTAFLVTSARIISFGSALFSGGGNLGADRTIIIGTPIGVGSGGTGQITNTAFGILYGSGASAIQALAAMVQGQIIVGSSSVLPPQFLNVGSAGQVLGINNAVPLSVAWVSTGAGGGTSVIYAPTGGEYVTYAANNTLSAERILTGGTNIVITTDTTSIFVSGSGKTIKFPLALLTVQPDSSNAFWQSATGTNVDMAYVAFVDSGEDLATWWGIVPFNLATTAFWSIDIYSTVQNTLGVGSARVTVRGNSITSGEPTDAVYTLLSSAANLAIFRQGTMTISSTSGGSYDSVLAISAGDYLTIELNRHGGSAADTVNDQWNVYSVVARMNVL